MISLPLQIVPRYVLSDHRGGLSADITGWDDLAGSVQQGGGVAALTTEAFRDTPFLMSFFRSGQSDSLSFIYQFPHRWRRGTLIRPHLHVMACADPAADENVYFVGQYAFASDTITTPANVGWAPIDLLFPIHPGDVFKEQIVDLTGGAGITPPADVIESSFLFLYLKRSGADPKDTYSTAKVGGTAAANLGLVSFDVHIQIEKPGGTQIEIPA